VCRRHGLSSATFYKWKSKYGGLEVSDAKRLRGLEDENRRLERLLAEAMLDNAAFKDLLGKRELGQRGATRAGLGSKTSQFSGRHQRVKGDQKTCDEDETKDPNNAPQEGRNNRRSQAFKFLTRPAKVIPKCAIEQPIRSSHASWVRS
jgi:hypothetical protein